jgi:hypothetical protein
MKVTTYETIKQVGELLRHISSVFYSFKKWEVSHTFFLEFEDSTGGLNVIAAML